MGYLIKNGRLINPDGKKQGYCDVYIDQGVVRNIGRDLVEDKGMQVIDAKGLWIVPGMVDMHVHLREPGFEHKETMESGTLAAAKGGFTHVAVMPNTKPSPDTVENLEYIKKLIDEKALVDVKVVGAITKGIAGTELAEIEGMATRGIVGITDDGKTVMNNELLEEAYHIAKKYQLPIICHCEDHDLAAGVTYSELTNAIENNIIARDLALGEKTGAHVHITHLSTAEGLDMIREYKAKGCNVTCDVTPHHIILDRDQVDMNNPLSKVNPPIRSEKDRLALIEGIIDGTVDAIATDHAPHEESSKTCHIDQASFGISGIEAAFSICYTVLCVQNNLPVEKLIQLMTTGPARIIGIDAGIIKEEAPANLVLINPETTWTIQGSQFISMGKNTPLNGRKVDGRVVKTFYNGSLVYGYI